MSESTPAIDAVITWVDGDDPAHRKKIEAYKTKATNPSQTAATRFSSLGEIEFCLRSIFAYAPWIRHVYIVTDSQTPCCLDRIKTSVHSTRVTIIDHKDIFHGYESFLPTFNTRTIAPLLWKIPGLSEQFIYFNDDYFLTRPMAPTDFFTDSGHAVLRGKWKSGLSYLIKETLKNIAHNPQSARPGHARSQYLAAKLAGFRYRFLIVSHTPHPYLKSSWADFFNNHPREVTKQLSYRFRHTSQFNADSLSAHWNLKLKKGIYRDDCPTATIHPESQTPEQVNDVFRYIRNTSDRPILCVQSMDNGSKELQASIVNQLNELIPEL